MNKYSLHKYLFVLALLCGGSGAVLAQGGVAPNTPVNTAFKTNIASARQFELKSPGVALAYYKKALETAITDEEKAQAQLGIGKTTQFRAKNEADPQGNNAARLAAFQIVLDLPGATATQKHEARMEMGSMQLNLEKPEAALTQLQPVMNSTDATAEQKVRAILLGGEALIGLKRYDEARQQLAAIPTDEKATPIEKKVAYRLTARTYLLQNNPRMAQAEMNKLARQPNLKDNDIAQIYIENGDFFREEKQPALARAAYEMIPVLADASNEANIKAILQIGATYFDEKNYERARETWNTVPAMRGANAALMADAYHSIGVSHLQEKNYEKAREAFRLWHDKVDLPKQVQAWETIAATYLEEKNYPAAREALTNIGKMLPRVFNVNDKSILQLRQQLGTAQTYRAEADFTNAAKTYKEILNSVPHAASVPSHYYDAWNKVKAAADELGKEKASMDAAYSIHEALEKHYPYEFNKAQANMAMGDILVAQGKKEEAKAKYQRVMELRKNYDDYKIAENKIKQIDAGG